MSHPLVAWTERGAGPPLLLIHRLIGRQDAAWRASMAFDSRPRLGEIRCPTLVLAGVADTAVPMHHARQLHEGIAGSELIVLDDGDHAVIWAQPAAFVAAVAAFLA
jgi:3-oxoadipate enol-lactonase